MDLIDRNGLIAKYDSVHVGAPGGARKLMVEAPTVKATPCDFCEWNDEKYMFNRPCNICRAKKKEN